MKKIILKTFLVICFATNIIYGQLYVDYSDIDSRDILDAMAFSGIGIFKFKIDSLEKTFNFYLIAEEFAGKDNLIKTDTLLGGGGFKLTNEKINEIRFLTKIKNDSFDKVDMFISTPVVSAWQSIEVEKKFARKHYWVRFENSDVNENHKIPLLFFGSEWDTIYNGQETTRFCSMDRVPVDLSGDAISEIPHFYVISYLLK